MLWRYIIHKYIGGIRLLVLVVIFKVLKRRFLGDVEESCFH